MKFLVILFLFSFVSERTPLAQGVATFQSVFYIMNYGAKCDGSTNDNVAINSAFAAAQASLAYQNNNAVVIAGPGGNATQGCVINSINATIFQRGTGANTRPRVVVRDMTLLCTGAGNVCFDGLGSDFLKINNVSIRGDGVAPPEICIQVGVISATSAAWNSLNHVNCNNEFTFAALYNFGSEQFETLDSVFANAHSTSGPIGTLGSITGGSSYTNGTYTAVPLTGGSGAGAQATVGVSGGAVATVVVSYGGKDYAPSDTLSATALSVGGTGTGFSIPVATVAPKIIVIDGENHWRASSAFQTETLPTDTWQSLTLVNLIDTSIRQLASGDALWLGWAGGLHIINGYILNQGGSNCVILYDNGVTKSGIPGPNWGLDLDFNCEGSISTVFHMSGSHQTPTIQSFRYRGYNQATTAVFGTASNITAAQINDLDVDEKFGTNVTPMFASAKLWTISGVIKVPNATYWNTPTFQGIVVAGSQVTPPNIGPVDIISSAALALSCDRIVRSGYIGPLCRVERTSDSTSLDLYADGFGNLDKGSETAFCANTTCAVSIAYDQSGNSGNCTQSTPASQPVLSLQVASLGNRTGMVFGDESAFALSCPATAAINDLWASGGYASIVTSVLTSANAADRIMYKSNGAISPGVGWDWRMNFVGTSQTFVIGSGTTGGQWATPALGPVPMVADLQYSDSSLSNVPVIGVQGTPQTITTTTQPVGTIPSDSGQPLLIGNNAATSGSRGFPGDIAEIIVWKTTPSAAQIEAVRRNQAEHYQISGVN